MSLQGQHDVVRNESGFVAGMAPEVTFGSSDLASLMQPTAKEALVSPDRKTVITHSSLASFVDGFTLPLQPKLSTQITGLRKPVACIALPNGPLLAAVTLAVANRYVAAPVSGESNLGAEQFKSDVLQSGAQCILTTAESAERLELAGAEWLVEHRVEVFVLETASTPGNELSTLESLKLKRLDGMWATMGGTQPEPNMGDDISIILFTSGTSGTKKVVPITTRNILSGVRFVVESWALTKEDVCLNMMPLHHV